MKKTIKRTGSLLLVALLLSALIGSASAQTAHFYEEQAQTLHALELFKGTSEAAFVPDLDGPLTREMGVVMVVRLAGREDAAQAMSEGEVAAVLAAYEDGSQVSVWARHHVAYAIANGMVEGVGQNRLSMGTDLEGRMFAAMILRQLGYTVDPDAYQEAALQLAAKNGLTQEEALRMNAKRMIRDDAVGMAFGALQAEDASGVKLIEHLAAAGAVDAGLAVQLGVLEEAPAQEGPGRLADYSGRAYGLVLDYSLVVADDGETVQELAFLFGPEVLHVQTQDEDTLTAAALAAIQDHLAAGDLFGLQMRMGTIRTVDTSDNGFAALGTLSGYEDHTEGAWREVADEENAVVTFDLDGADVKRTIIMTPSIYVGAIEDGRVVYEPGDLSDVEEGKLVRLYTVTGDDPGIVEVVLVWDDAAMTR